MPQAFGINNSGQVAGYVNTDSTTQAFIGTISGPTLISLPSGWSWSQARGINDSGQVAGWGGPDIFSMQAFIGTTSGSTPIPRPAGWSEVVWTKGYGINNSGQVAGLTFEHYPPELAFIGTTAGSTAIPFIPGAEGQNVGFFPLNNAGQVVGESSPADAWPPAGWTGEWVWDALHGTRILNDLVPEEWRVGGPQSINDNGQILAVGANSSTHFVGYVLLDPIPEPTTGVLLAGGLAVLAVLVRRRRPHRRAGSQRA
jgi:uncharacterized membrane protein